MGEKKKKKINIKPSAEVCDKTSEAVDKIGGAFKESFKDIFYAITNQSLDVICEYMDKTTETIKRKIKQKGKKENDK